MEDDAVLIEGVIQNRPGFDARLVERYRGLVLGLARGRYSLRADQAEEIFQATMLRLLENDHRALRAWRGQGRFSTYLTVIVIRLCQQERIRGRLSDSAVPLDDAQHPTTTSSADEELVDEEKQTAVEQAMRDLSPRQQLLLKLRFVDDRSPQEIATVLKMNPGAARKALHDAKEKLVARLRGSKPELFAR